MAILAPKPKKASVAEEDPDAGDPLSRKGGSKAAGALKPVTEKSE
jgi:hypothetical protein